jgi:ketosteroid isomerase-like protein
VAGLAPECHTRAVIDQLREAARAMGEGDPEPFIGLLHPDVDWSGLEQGFLWWRQAPSCHGRGEAGELLRSGIARRGSPLRSEPEFDLVGEKIVASAVVADREGVQHRRFHVFSVRDGQIGSMHAFRSRRAAERFARAS